MPADGNKRTSSITRRTFSVGLPLALGAGAAPAQDAARYPSKPIRFVVPFTTGGGADAAMRPIAEKLGERLHAPVVVDNRPGASGFIGIQNVIQAAPDGHTLLLGYDGSLVVAPNLIKAPFDSVADLTPISKMGDVFIVIAVHPSLGVSTLQELVALSRTRPGGIPYGSPGVGTTNHVTGELLGLRSGMKVTHVPYKGGGQAVADVVSGQIPMMLTSVTTISGFVRDGRLKAIAITGNKRSPMLPDVPTVAECGVPNLNVSSWYGLLAPPRTPRAIVERLNREMVAILALPEIRDKYVKGGFDPVSSSPEEFGRQIQADLGTWKNLLREAKVQAE